jgi:molybdopterin converting factor subunit 1
MRLQLKLFASFREAVGARELVWEMQDGATVQALLDSLVVRYPDLSKTLDQGMVALNHEYVAHDAALSDGDEVGLIPPVSGGASW